MEFHRVKRFLLHLFFPNRCPFCGAVIACEEHACETCANALHRMNPCRCAVCHGFACTCPQSGHPFERVVSVFPYADLPKRAILQMKFHGHRVYAESLGWYLAQQIQNGDLAWKPDLILPVPMTRKKRRKRGYNQAALLAKSVSDSLHLPLCTDVLLKPHETAAQHTLSAYGRRYNLRGAYAVKHAEVIRNRAVLLIDDVYTTGATASECAATLLAHGAKSVMVGTICKVCAVGKE